MEPGSQITRAQRKFLREFCNGPHGPPVSDWPLPAILRGWLRKSGFRAALRSLMGVMRFEADFQLAPENETGTEPLHKVRIHFLGVCPK